MVGGQIVLAVIPARGGSKSLPRKNVRMLKDNPLIAYSIFSAQGSATIDRTIVSTDDAAIADVARTYGAEVPFLRPPELALDLTPDLPCSSTRWLGSPSMAGSCRTSSSTCARPARFATRRTWTVPCASWPNAGRGLRPRSESCAGEPVQDVRGRPRRLPAAALGWADSRRP